MLRRTMKFLLLAGMVYGLIFVVLPVMAGFAFLVLAGEVTFGP